MVTEEGGHDIYIEAHPSQPLGDVGWRHRQELDSSRRRKVGPRRRGGPGGFLLMDGKDLKMEFQGVSGTSKRSPTRTRSIYSPPWTLEHLGSRTTSAGAITLGMGGLLPNFSLAHPRASCPNTWCLRILV
jgi:hypothetical protein